MNYGSSKSVEVSEAWPDTYDEGIYTSIPTWIHSKNLLAAAEAPSLKFNLLNDHKDYPNQHENSHKLCDESGNPVENLMGSQWKLRQQHQNFPMEGKPL